MASVKKNFSYNSILTLSTYVVNIFLFPYVARILGAEILGQIGFVYNAISYFSLFALLGLPVLGIREIAACGDNREERSKVFSSMLFLILLSTILVTIIFVITIFYVEKFYRLKELFFIGTISLFSTSFLLEWFFQGIENFKFITIRTLFVKVVYFVLVLILIKDPSDYLLYFFLTCLVVLLNALLSFSYAKKFVDISFKNISAKKYIKSSLKFGTYRLIISMYVTFNVIYLGFVCTDIEVGYYYTATKLLTIGMGLLTAFTNVMLPRMSALLSEGKDEEFKKYILKSFDLILSVALPLSIFLSILSPDIIMLFVGKGYEGAILPMSIVMINIVSVGFAQIYVLQVLVPLKLDNVILKSSFLGLISGVLLNILLVNRFAAVGSALVLIVSEFLGDLYNYIYVHKRNLIPSPFMRIIKYLFLSIPYALFCLFSSYLFENNIIVIFVAAILCLVYFIALNCYCLKDSLVYYKKIK